MSHTTVATKQLVQVYGGTLKPLDPSLPSVEIRNEPVTVGRGAGCSLVLADKKVSTVHAEFMATPTGVRVRDTASRNGTYVDGHRCLEMYLLASAEVQFGDTAYQFTPGGPLSVETESDDSFGDLTGNTDVMRKLFATLRRVAATDLSMLITGETGVGKELVAQAIHATSPRAAHPFIVIDCAAIPTNLVESMLFGHEKGAFTGASERRLSPFVQADGGTVFLDEIGELPLELQPKFLRVLQQRQVQAIGSHVYRPVNVRVLAATRRDLRREINAGSFRDDLYFRFAKMTVHVPPLRERADDVLPLIPQIAKRLGYAEKIGRVSKLSTDRLMKYDWPGNVRELCNLVEVGLSLAGEQGPIHLDEHLAKPRTVKQSLPRRRHDAAMTAADKSYWEDLATSCSGNVTVMARESGRSRPTVRKYLDLYGIGGNDDGAGDD